MAVSLLLENVAFAVQPIGEGNKNLLFQDQQSGIVVVVPLSEDGVKELDRQLISDGKIEVATAMPKPMNREQRRASERGKKK